MEQAGIHAEIYGRAKHFFSIYKKMVNQHKTIDQIYDLFAIRIIVDDKEACYSALGTIHEHYKPIPGRFKDYIAMPKPNNYQSLHTTLIGPTGTPFEIQIRTWDMHRISEYGIAAHWKYKESGEGATVKGEEEKLSWLRQILELQTDMKDNKEFVSLLKSDLNLFSDTVFCFTPTGDVKNLPFGSNPIDFAYSIHSAVGNKMIGAKVNGRLVPLDYTIQNGDRIEVITSGNSKGPSRDWLKIVKSTQAKNKINQWFRAQSRDEDVLKGKEMMAAYAKAHDIDLGLVNKPEYQRRVLRKYGFHDWENILAVIGHGGVKEGQVVNRLYDAYVKDHPKVITDQDILDAARNNSDDANIAAAKKKPEEGGAAHKHKDSNGIVVRGLNDMSVRFSKCCSPLPGDEIVGFITRGRGVSIHRTDCQNIISLPDIEKQRLIEAEWEEEAYGGKNGLYNVEIRVYATNKVGVLVDISKVFSEADINIVNINTISSKKEVKTLALTFMVHGKEELSSLISKLRQLDCVIDVERTAG